MFEAAFHWQLQDVQLFVLVHWNLDKIIMGRVSWSTIQPRFPLKIQDYHLGEMVTSVSTTSSVLPGACTGGTVYFSGTTTIFGRMSRTSFRACKANCRMEQLAAMFWQTWVKLSDVSIGQCRAFMAKGWNGARAACNVFL